MIGIAVRVLPLTVAGYAVAGGSDSFKEVADEAMNAVLKLKSSTEMRGIVKSIRLDMVAGEPFPDDLEEYIYDNMDSQGTDPTLDAWGTPYEALEQEGARYIVSCGPDESCGTKDDICAIVHDEQGRFRSKIKRRRR